MSPYITIRTYDGSRPLQPFWFYQKVSKSRKKIKRKNHISYLLKNETN